MTQQPCNDDATTTGLTGASGALKAWGAMASAAGIQALTRTRPAGITDFWFDPQNGLKYSAPCDDKMVRIPASTTMGGTELSCDEREAEDAKSSNTLWEGIKSWLQDN